MSYILDADIRSFFDDINQQWLIRFLERRIGDRRIIRLIQKWFNAGVMEDGVATVSGRGTGQGSVISPLLACIYLHYTLDLWAIRWRQREATGDGHERFRWQLFLDLNSNISDVVNRMTLSCFDDEPELIKLMVALSAEHLCIIKLSGWAR